MKTKTDVKKTVLPSDLVFDKIQDGDGRHFDNQFIGHISVATAHIRTKFATRTKNNVLDTILPSEFTFQKSKSNDSGRDLNGNFQRFRWLFL